MGKPARLKSLSAPAPEDTFSSSSSPTIPAKAAEKLHRAFEALGLTPYQAKVQVALLQAGPANCLELARLAGIPRTSIYQILDELDAKGVASRLPGNGPAVWSSAGRTDVLDRLVALEEERLTELKSRSARVAQMLDELLPEQQMASLPYVQVIHDPSRVKPLYEQLLMQTEHELLVFNRPPYALTIGRAQPVIVDTARRAEARVLYQAAQAEGPEYDAWHHEMAAYHDLGVEGRVVEELPIKLAIFDRKATLLSLDDPLLPQVGFPITLLIEHPGYSKVQANAFENLWASATPYETVVGERLRFTGSDLA